MTDEVKNDAPTSAAPVGTFTENAHGGAGPAPETQLVDAAVAVATPVLEEAAVSLRDKLVAEGHALIDRHLTQAKRLADLQPSLRPLMPIIAACLHDLFNHMTKDVTQEQQAPAT